MMPPTRWFETRFDPYAPGAGPPPRTFLAFVRWMLAGTGVTLALLGLVSLGLGIAEVAAAWMVGWLVDGAAAAPAPRRYLDQHWPGVALVLAFFLLARPLLIVLHSGLSSISLTPGLFHLAVWRLHRHTLGQSLKFFEDDFAGRISQKQMQTANALAESMNELFNAVAQGIAVVLAASVLLVSTDWRLALMLAVWFAAYLVVVVRCLPGIRAASRGRAATRAGLSGQLVDSLSHMTTVKVFAHAGREEAAARDALARFRAAALRFARRIFGFRCLLAVLAGALPAAMIGLALWLWQAGQAGPGIIAMAGLLSTRIAHMSGWISFSAMNIFTHLGTVEDGMHTLTPGHGVTDRPGAVEPRAVRGAISFEDVTFRYGREGGDGGGGLDRFSLAVAPGEKVALVGRSGAGKSTALALLLRLHDVEFGRITLDGRDIRDLTQDGLRRQIAMITQEPAMFNRSALDNILYGRPEADPEAAFEAAREAAAHDFIEELGDWKGRTGYAAHLGERGVKLSGGQRQRIALARAILKDAPVLVLDEATAALDSETEATVQAALGRLMSGKTVIAIAHRLSTIARMDRIVVMEAGRVVEQGTHHQLLARDGLYARFWAHQSGGLIAVDAAE